MKIIISFFLFFIACNSYAGCVPEEGVSSFEEIRVAQDCLQKNIEKLTTATGYAELVADGFAQEVPKLMGSTANCNKFVDYLAQSSKKDKNYYLSVVVNCEKIMNYNKKRMERTMKEFDKANKELDKANALKDILERQLKTLEETEEQMKSAATN